MIKGLFSITKRLPFASLLIPFQYISSRTIDKFEKVVAIIIYHNIYTSCLQRLVSQREDRFFGYAILRPWLQVSVVIICGIRGNPCYPWIPHLSPSSTDKYSMKCQQDLAGTDVVNWTAKQTMNEATRINNQNPKLLLCNKLLVPQHTSGLYY